MASFQAKIGWKEAEKERKQILSFRFIPTQRVIENSKKIAKKLKNTIMAPFQPTQGWRRMRKEEKKNYRFVPFLPDA